MRFRDGEAKAGDFALHGEPATHCRVAPGTLLERFLFLLLPLRRRHEAAALELVEAPGRTLRQRLAGEDRLQLAVELDHLCLQARDPAAEGFALAAARGADLDALPACRGDPLLSQGNRDRADGTIVAGGARVHEVQQRLARGDAFAFAHAALAHQPRLLRHDPDRAGGRNEDSGERRLLRVFGDEEVRQDRCGDEDRRDRKHDEGQRTDQYDGSQRRAGLLGAHLRAIGGDGQERPTMP